MQPYATITGEDAAVSEWLVAEILQLPQSLVLGLAIKTKVPTRVTTYGVIISNQLDCRNTIWHGVNPWGEKSHYNCEDWSSDNPLHVGLASSLEGGLIAKQKKHSCNNKFHILCIEI